jgi:hypothetical protein
MEEGFEDGACVLWPIQVVLGQERLACSSSNDVNKPRVEHGARQEFTKESHDPFGLHLQRVHLEALVIEPIDRIFVPPMVVARPQEIAQVWQVALEVSQQRCLGGLFFLSVNAGLLPWR